MDRDRTASLQFRTSKDLRLWVNGKPVVDGFGGWNLQGSPEVWVPITLQAGRNQLLVKVNSAWCQCQFHDAPARRAFSMFELGLWSEAADLFAEADRLEPISPWWVLHRVRCLLAVGRNDEARRVFDEAVPRHEQTTDKFARNHLGLACPWPPEKNPDRDRAVALQLELMDREPNTGKHYWLGHAYFRAARFDDAEKSIRQALARDDRLGHYPLLASTLHHLGRADEARQVLQAAEERFAALVKKALAAQPYQTPLNAFEELFFRSTLPEARMLIRGKDSGPTADETASPHAPIWPTPAGHWTAGRRGPSLAGCTRTTTGTCGCVPACSFVRRNA